MRGEKLLEAVGYLDPELIKSAAGPESEKTSAQEEKESAKKRSALLRRVSSAAAVFLAAAGLLLLSLWAFLPRAGEEVLRIRLVRVGERIAEYRVEQTSRFREWTARSRLGEEFGENLYRVRGRDDLVRLIYAGADSKPELLRFSFFLTNLTQDSPLLAASGLTEEDRAALAYGESCSFGEVLDLIYGVSAPEALESVTFEKDAFDRSAAGKRVTVEKTVLRDEEGLSRFWDILNSLVRSSSSEPSGDGPRRIWAADPGYLNGSVPLSIQTDRLVTVRLTTGEKLVFHYSPREGMLYENYGVLYDPISAEDNEWLIGRAGIDLAPRDWGTNPVPAGAETAAPPGSAGT